MFAIIKTGGKQYRVTVGDILEVERLGQEAGARVDFNQVLLIDDGSRTLLGTPVLENALVRAELVNEFKDDKVIVFKKKRRKQYKKKKGHRQILNQVRILEIIPDTRQLEGKIPAAEAKEEKLEPAPVGLHREAIPESPESEVAEVKKSRPQVPRQAPRVAASEEKEEKKKSRTKKPAERKKKS